MNKRKHTPHKWCDECHVLNFAAVHKCDCCGYEFPKRSTIRSAADFKKSLIEASVNLGKRLRVIK